MDNEFETQVFAGLFNKNSWKTWISPDFKIFLHQKHFLILLFNNLIVLNKVLCRINTMGLLLGYKSGRLRWTEEQGKRRHQNTPEAPGSLRTEVAKGQSRQISQADFPSSVLEVFSLEGQWLSPSPLQTLGWDPCLKTRKNNWKPQEARSGLMTSMHFHEEVLKCTDSVLLTGELRPC